jgi:hypothetical protein
VGPCLALVLVNYNVVNNRFSGVIFVIYRESLTRLFTHVIK